MRLESAAERERGSNYTERGFNSVLNPNIDLNGDLRSSFAKFAHSHKSRMVMLIHMLIDLTVILLFG